MTRRNLRRACGPSHPRGQRGVVAIVVGLTMAVMLGFVGLAIDGGRLYLTKTELQNAADACALPHRIGATMPIANAATTTRRLISCRCDRPGRPPHVAPRAVLLFSVISSRPVLDDAVGSSLKRPP